MINLSDVQKEILILLLIALGVSLIILFVSYIIWKNFCEPKLDEGRRNRQEQQDPFSVQLDTGDGESSALRSPDGARGEGTVSDIRYHRVLPIYPPLTPENYHALRPSAMWHRNTHQVGQTNPTAPSLSSFYTRSSASIPSNNTEAVSQISGGTGELPLTESSAYVSEGEALPTYQELMNRDRR